MVAMQTIKTGLSDTIVAVKPAGVIGTPDFRSF